MTWKLMPGAIAALALLAGCAANPAGPSSEQNADASSSAPQACNADMAESAVGKKISSALVEDYRKQSGSKTARALRPNDVMTLEYNPQRLNLRTDDKDIVISVNCG
ncbi:I78 family peptidase inhibitor [Pollutimonas sp. H1-120]|uniref:I78 family peptidase inhibitor n=1 Tax=Pollutimonas sp. H1-120 TaxID=3148824 RepID=UPI003B524FD9